VISIRVGRPVPLDELLAEHSAMPDAAKRVPATAAVASASTLQWKFLCIEGYSDD